MSEAVARRGMYWLADDTVITNTHPEGMCATRGACALHAPSDHALRDAPLVSYPPTGGLGRRCEHQVHPDIDDVVWRDRGATNYFGRVPGWVHQPCCGCCGLDLTPWLAEDDVDQ